MKKFDLHDVNRNTSNFITMVETKEGSIAIIDKKELLSGEDKVKLINNYFETGDIKVPTKNIGFYVSRDSDFNFIEVQVYERQEKKEIHYTM